MNENVRPAYRLPKRLSRFLILFLLLDLLAAAVALVTGFMARFPLVRLQRGLASDEVIAAVLANETRHNLVSLVHFAIGAIVAVLFLVWVYRVARNAHAMTIRPMRFTAGSAVWWYFVPIYNIFRPYQAFFELWSVSADPDAPYRKRRTDMLALWWFLWLTSSGLHLLAIPFLLRHEEIAALLTGNFLRLVADFFSILLVLALVRIVVRLNRLQADYHARLHAQAQARPAAEPHPPAALHA